MDLEFPGSAMGSIEHTMSYADFRNNRITELATIVASPASVLGLIVSIFFGVERWTPWLIVAVAFAFTVTIGLILMTIFKADRTTRRYDPTDTRGINKYLFDWISNGGRVVIWTRNMSWADSHEMMPMLRKKAEEKELIICLPHRIEKSDELESYGAEVIAYEILDSPSVTFTIVNFARAGSRVAVGRRSGDKHVIQEYSAEEHPAFHLASDLVQLVRAGDNASQ